MGWREGQALSFQTTCRMMAEEYWGIVVDLLLGDTQQHSIWHRCGQVSLNQHRVGLGWREMVHASEQPAHKSRGKSLLL